MSPTRVLTSHEFPVNDLVDRIRGHLAEYLHGRPETIQLDTTGLTIDQTYIHLMNLLKT